MDCPACDHPTWLHGRRGIPGPGCIAPTATPGLPCGCCHTRDNLEPRGVIITDDPAAPYPATYETRP